MEGGGTSRTSTSHDEYADNFTTMHTVGGKSKIGPRMKFSRVDAITRALPPSTARSSHLAQICLQSCDLAQASRISRIHRSTQGVCSQPKSLLNVTSRYVTWTAEFSGLVNAMGPGKLIHVHTRGHEHLNITLVSSPQSSYLCTPHTLHCGLQQMDLMAAARWTCRRRRRNHGSPRLD